MLPPRNLRELRGLQGRLAYIRRFISNLSERCQPFTRLLKKDTPFIWDQACQNAFESIKQYLTRPPVLMTLIQGKPSILCTAALKRPLGAMLAQCNGEGKENVLCYISRIMVGAEVNYSSMEKICLTFVFPFKNYDTTSYPIRSFFISKADPLRCILSKHMLSGRLAKWAMLLAPFDIKFMP